MLTLNLGPLALPLAPLLLLLFLFGTAWAVRRHAQAPDREAAETAVWWSVAVGLLVARLAHVVSHRDSYAGAPLDLIDIRDGGFLWPAGVLSGSVVMVWRVRRTVQASGRAVLATACVGMLLWLGVSSAVPWLSPAPGQQLAAVAVRLQKLETAVVPGAQPSPSAPSASSASSPAASQMAPPALTLEEISQRAGGKPVVLNLWATWCGPCRAEMPLLARAQKAHPQVLFIFANQGEGEAAIRGYLQRERLDLKEVWRDPASALGPAVGSSGLPTTVYFDSTGQRLGAHVGVLSEGALQVIVRKVAAPASGP